MPYVEPLFDPAEVDAAGEFLIDILPLARDIDAFAAFEQAHHAEAVINNWRAAHNWPMTAFNMTLRNRAKSLDHNSITAQRTKRLESIKKKLRARSDLRLSEIQDIGGCRVVLGDVDMVKELVRMYDANTPAINGLVSRNDYIGGPRPTGYRGIHRIYRYQTPTESRKCYDGLRIELQFRTNLQHAWATAVETVDTFTGQDLKSGRGEPDWQRFFALMSSVMAMREGTHLVPRTPRDPHHLHREIRDLATQLEVEDKLFAYRAVGQHIQRTRSTTNAKHFVMTLNVQGGGLQLQSFNSRELNEATAALQAAEKEVGVHSVLVSVENLAALYRAYPNFFADTGEFLDELMQV